MVNVSWPILLHNRLCGSNTEKYLDFWDHIFISNQNRVRINLWIAENGYKTTVSYPTRTVILSNKKISSSYSHTYLYASWSSSQESLDLLFRIRPFPWQSPSECVNNWRSGSWWSRHPKAALSSTDLSIHFGSPLCLRFWRKRINIHHLQVY